MYPIAVTDEQPAGGKHLAGTGQLTGAEQLIASSFARRAPAHRQLAQILGAGLQALRTSGFVAATPTQVWQAAINAGLAQAAPPVSAAQLVQCPLVGAAGSQAPVISDAGLLYFRINFELELQLAELLAARAQSAPTPGHFAAASIPLADEQARAMSAAAAQALTVVSGGPGTGKTTSVAALIAGWLQAGIKPADIAIAAPTGKAAARLNGALQATLEQALPGIHAPEAGTLHRLLGWRPQQAGYRFNASNRLRQQRVVIDEVSMVDLQLMHALVSAVTPSARLILLGDKDQLVSVQPGSVLADIYAGLGGADCLFTLTRNFRFSGRSDIAALATAIRTGDADGAVSRLGSGADELTWLPDLRQLEPMLRPYREALDCADDQQIWRGLGRLRFLSAHRRGPYGAERLNQRIIALLGLAENRSGAGMRPGTLFAVTSNHYGLRFFNGDQGFVRPGGEATNALVERPDGSLRELSVVRLPAVEAAFAMTVHRAQGSEFEQVVIVLPPPDSPLLTRELLYTAVTRARSKVTIVGSEAAVRAAIDRPSLRGSGLAARLGSALAGSGQPGGGVQGHLF